MAIAGDQSPTELFGAFGELSHDTLAVALFVVVLPSLHLRPYGGFAQQPAIMPSDDPDLSPFAPSEALPFPDSMSGFPRPILGGLSLRSESGLRFAAVSPPSVCNS